MIALLCRGYALADIDHHARALMAEDGGEQALRIGAGKGELVGVADAGGFDLDQHFALARAFQVNGFDRERLSGLKGNGGAGFHGKSSRTGEILLSRSGESVPSADGECKRVKL